MTFVKDQKMFISMVIILVIGISMAVAKKGNGGKMVAKPDELDTRLEGFEPTTLGSEDRCSVR